MNKILFCGIDGFTPSYAEKLLDDSFWHKIKNSCSIAKIPKPEAIKRGDIGTASSPRMWLRYYAGVPPEKGGPCGFWEKSTKTGCSQSKCFNGLDSQEPMREISGLR